MLPLIRAIVVDDEELTLREIKTLIDQTGYIQVAKALTDPWDALAEARAINPQVAFIDIEMPEMDGITLAEKLLEANPSLQVVFITAYNQYAIHAFDINALDYILKPINPKRFQVMTEKVKKAVADQRPTSDAQLVITCFDSLCARIGRAQVKWGRSKAEELFAFLVMNHGLSIHKEVILETLWPDDDPRRSTPILQTAMCKLRNIFSPLGRTVRLEYADGKYCLIISQCSCDYFDVCAAIDSFRLLAVASHKSVEAAATLVSRGFLARHGYMWALEKNQELQTKMNAILKQLVKHYVSVDRDVAIRILKLLVNSLPYDEEGNNLLLECLARNNDGAGLIQHYQWLQNVLQDQYEMEPALSTRRLYDKLYAEKYH